MHTINSVHYRVVVRKLNPHQYIAMTYIWGHPASNPEPSLQQQSASSSSMASSYSQLGMRSENNKKKQTKLYNIIQALYCASVST